MTRDDGERWRRQVYERIAAAVRSARRARSAQAIADETASLGFPITRSQISNFETGRRQSIDIAELMILAAALGVPPITLLFGGDPDADVELLPGQVESVLTGLAWFTGAAELAALPPGKYPDASFTEGQLPYTDTASAEAMLLDLLRERAAKRSEVNTLMNLHGLGTGRDAARLVTERLAEVRKLDAEIAGYVAQIERRPRTDDG